MALVGWIFISRRSQRLDDLEKQNSLKDAREQLLGARKENELLTERSAKAESLETELRQLLKESENEGARMVAELENLVADSRSKKENEESAKSSKKNLKIWPTKY